MNGPREYRCSLMEHSRAECSRARSRDQESNLNAASWHRTDTRISGYINARSSALGMKKILWIRKHIETRE
jgi:hypothetical protein